MGRAVNPDLADHLMRVSALAVGAASGAAAGLASSWSMVIFGVPLAVVFAAFAGAMVSLGFLPGATLGRTLIIVLSGTTAGAYLSALVSEWWGFSPAAMGGAAFVVGGALQWAVPALIARVKREGERQ